MKDTEKSKMGEILSAERIAQLLENTQIPVPKVYDRVTSTNILAKEAARLGAPRLYCVAASSQSAGRGRLGRSFYSPGGCGLYMSVVLRPDASEDVLMQLTGTAAVAVCLAIRDCFSIETEIKWVNDVYFGGKKVCGILTEASFGGNAAPEYAIVGIGINICPPDGGFPPEISDRAGCLLDSPQPDAANRLCAAVLLRLYKLYTSLCQSGSKDIAAEYRRRCLTCNNDINILSDGKIIGTGYAADVDDCFRLIVRYPDGTALPLSAGEVSVLLK